MWFRTGFTDLSLPIGRTRGPRVDLHSEIGRPKAIFLSAALPVRPGPSPGIWLAAVRVLHP